MKRRVGSQLRKHSLLMSQATVFARGSIGVLVSLFRASWNLAGSYQYRQILTLMTIRWIDAPTMRVGAHPILTRRPVSSVITVSSSFLRTRFATVIILPNAIDALRTCVTLLHCRPGQAWLNAESRYTWRGLTGHKLDTFCFAAVAQPLLQYGCVLPVLGSMNFGRAWQV